MVMGMAENYKHLYEQTKKMLTMYQDELIPGFRKKIEELEAKVATDNNVGSKWIPVTERLPDYFHVFIVAIRMPYREGLFVDSADFDPFEKTWLPSLCWDKGYEVTHWMPLSPAPKGE